MLIKTIVGHENNCYSKFWRAQVTVGQAPSGVLKICKLNPNIGNEQEIQKTLEAVKQIIQKRKTKNTKREPSTKRFYYIFSKLNTNWSDYSELLKMKTALENFINECLKPFENSLNQQSLEEKQSRIFSHY